MAQGLFTLKQVNQALRQGAWSSASTTPVYAAGFNGSSQYLNVSSATIAATGQFCIEAWVFQTGRSVSSSQGIFSQYSAGVSGRFYFRFNADKLSFTTSAGDNISTSSVYVNTWYHVAVTRDASNVLRMFINGVLDCNATVTQSLQVTTPQIAAIANGENWQGYISNLRTVSGSIPTSYQTSSTTNGTVVFTPPTTNLTTTSQGASGTSLLTLQNATIIDNSSNAYTITNNGTVAMSLNYGVFNPTIKTSAVEYLVVAGGGSGGGTIGGGGGAGGLLTGIVTIAAGTSYTVTVGAGGAAKISNSGQSTGNSGNNSVFGAITSSGGGGGGSYINTGPNDAISGGSGGGGAAYDSGTLSGANGVSGQGNQGGSGKKGTTPWAGGGGGGAGTVGLAGTGGYGGNGGAGVASAISGTTTTYSGGGGGGVESGTIYGFGGVGGGGNGASSSSTTTNNTAGSGSSNSGGGGGGGAFNTGVTSGAGGSGIVIVSYPDVYAAPTATTGSPTVSTSGSGSINFATAGYFSTGTGTAPSQSGDFTLEGWFNLSTFNQSGGYALLGGTTGGANYFGFKSTNIVINSATTSAEKLIACTLPSTNTWFHYCVMRSGSTLYAFLNGSLQGSSTWTDVLFSSGSLLVGGYGSATYICPGYMSNLRLTNTAVYSTSGFTVPTSPLTRVTGTALLMNTVSGAYAADSTGTWSFLNLYTAPTWNAASPFTVTGYKNRVYTWTSSGSITF